MTEISRHLLPLLLLKAVRVRGILYGMDEAKLTVRILRETLDAAKLYAREHDTTLTRLVVTHLEQLRREGDALADAPITRRLAGSLPSEASMQEYRDFLEQKYA
jgi:hypothetical protein